MDSLILYLDVLNKYASLILVNFGVTPLANSELETGPYYKGVSFEVTPPVVEEKATVDSNIVTVPEVVVTEDNREALENAITKPEPTLPEGETKVEVPTESNFNTQNKTTQEIKITRKTSIRDLLKK